MTMLTAILLMFASLTGQSAQADRPADPRGSGAFQRIYDQWTLACEDPSFRGHVIQFQLTLDAGGRIVEGPTPVRPREDAGWRRAAETAREALVRSAPFEVPADFTGGKYRPTFNMTGLCARAAEADED